MRLNHDTVLSVVGDTWIRCVDIVDRLSDAKRTSFAGYKEYKWFKAKCRQMRYLAVYNTLQKMLIAGTLETHVNHSEYRCGRTYRKPQTNNRLTHYLVAVNPPKLPAIVSKQEKVSLSIETFVKSMRDYGITEFHTMNIVKRAIESDAKNSDGVNVDRIVNGINQAKAAISG